MAMTIASFSNARSTLLSQCILLVGLFCLIPSLLMEKQTNFRLMEKQILDSVVGSSTYDFRIRPSGLNASDVDDAMDPPAIVRVNMLIRSISRIDDVTMEYSIQITFREEWNDDRLQYDDMNGKIRFLVLTDPNKIWKPDLFFKNEKKGHLHNIIMPNVLLRIFPNGNVLYSTRISLVLFCPMDLKYYPLDQQTCFIQMASYGYTTEDLVFLWKEGDPVQVVPSYLPRFTLQSSETSYCTSRTNTGEYSCLVVYLVFKREFSYYLIQIYIPCCMLVIVSWVSFWLDPNAIPARVSLGVTTLLTMATQISGINASLPPVSYTKAIDVWTGSCLTFVFGALLEFALVNYASRRDAHRAARKKKQQQAALTAQQTVDVELQEAGLDGDDGFDAASLPFAKVEPLVRSFEELADKLRECEIHSSPRRANCCKRWLNRFPTRSKRIDVISRIAFPLLFALFNGFYWTTYLFRGDIKAT